MGNLLVLVALLHCQRAGHDVIAVVSDVIYRDVIVVKSFSCVLLSVLLSSCTVTSLGVNEKRKREFCGRRVLLFVLKGFQLFGFVTLCCICSQEVIFQWVINSFHKNVF